jgi:hypothetical protein
MSQSQKEIRRHPANFHVPGGIRKSTGGKAPVSYAGKTTPGGYRRASGIEREFMRLLALA